ncbi:putative RNAse P, Rpr2/Rpp21 subunit protein [Arabidopsis thaliana]
MFRALGPSRLKSLKSQFFHNKTLLFLLSAAASLNLSVICNRLKYFPEVDLKTMGKRGPKKLTNTQGGGGPNLKSVLRHEHLKNLALWSSTGDTPIPSLASLLGRRLAADTESTGITTDPDLVSCQRCETILKPGFNCNVRIEKVSANVKKKRNRCKKSNNICFPQNNVVYHCNFCSHRNLKRGTAKGQMKELYPFNPKTARSSRPKIKKEMTMPQEIQSNMLSSPERSVKDQVEENSVGDTPKPMMLTLERDRRIRKPKSKKPIEPQSVPEKTVGGSNKRKRKSPWTSMKEIAETNKSSKAGNFKIPFLL